MKLDVTGFRYITKEEFRVLTAVEMGMRNHELVPAPLIESIAKVNRGSTFKIIQTLLRHKLLAHDGGKNDGYRMTYHGYDYLAIRALAARGTIQAVGRRLGVGKESDVHYCQGPKGEVLALKLHRLGRISFRAIKQKRDYLQHRTHGSWQYMARLAAVKEFAYMKALYDEGFPVPQPWDQNRHCVVMSLVEARPLYHIRSLNRPNHVLERLMRLLVRLARAGIVHGDFNEFNLMIDNDDKVTLIDFPQIVHLNHPNAGEFFDRDVQGVRDFFRKRLDIEVEQWPIWTEVLAECGIVGEDGQAEKQIRPDVQGMGKGDDDLLTQAHEQGRKAGPEDPEASDDESGSENSEAGEEEEEPAADQPKEGFQELGVVAGPEGEEDAAEPGEGEDAGGDAGGDAGDAGSDADSASDGEESDGPAQVTIAQTKRVRKKQTAKDARKNLQKQQQNRHAKPNMQKNKELRKSRHEVKEYMQG